MALWNEIGNRLAWLFRRSRFDRELDEEMRFHIQTRAEELQQDGLSGADAPNASAARVRFHAAEPGRVSQPSCHDPGSLVQISVSGNTFERHQRCDG